MTTLVISESTLLHNFLDAQEEGAPEQFVI
jgi:hypothetical protein